MVLNEIESVKGYEYVDTISEQEEKITLEFNYDIWKNVYSNEYATFEDYKDHHKELFSNEEVLEDNSQRLILWNGDYQKVYRLVYEVEVTDFLDNVSKKQAEITIAETPDEVDKDDQYQIIDIQIE
ncbi:hypothetical protein CHI12_09475 [Terribacillus saccharophilus]|uniref:Uncharacterized protein n=1 Tax=Terribacillus saccharophilus TaxID=361277 RepID=A0A268HD34_9BACI|nr:hypothetical protein [Terribacillus saccharophilus]PAE07787.1 hypothetical protein CHI12_09475 [Terribacillus saccharophilus]